MTPCPGEGLALWRVGGGAWRWVPGEPRVTVGLSPDPVRPPPVLTMDLLPPSHLGESVSSSENTNARVVTCPKSNLSAF